MFSLVWGEVASLGALAPALVVLAIDVVKREPNGSLLKFSVPPEIDGLQVALSLNCSGFLEGLTRDPLASARSKRSAPFSMLVLPLKCIRFYNNSQCVSCTFAVEGL